MNRLKFLLPMAGVMVLASCSQEELIQGSESGKGSQVSFRSGMGTRVNDFYNYKIVPSQFYATGFIGNHMSENAVPQFADAPFSKIDDNTWVCGDGKHDTSWPADGSSMEFFAYAPSLDAIKIAAKINPGVDDDILGYFNFYNMCGENASTDPIGNGTFDEVPSETLRQGYKLGRFYVATEIDQQIDFITAHTEGFITDHQTSVPLKFYHQLSNIELRAFSNNPVYDIEIAGVRIGGAYTGKAIFNFCDTYNSTSSEKGGRWGFANDPQRLAMQYVFTKDDDTYKMTGTDADEDGVHVKKSDAESIMGKGGNAMVLPTHNKGWEGMDNQWIHPKYAEDDNDATRPQQWGSANGEILHGDSYFSILVRVTTKTSGTLIYPYPNRGDMNTVAIYKDKVTGKVKGNNLKTSSQPEPLTTAPEGTDEYRYGWVCVPVDAEWKQGYKYIYTLDFTDGVGIQDPEDPQPGSPIIGNGIKFSVSIQPWDDGGNTDI